MFTIKNKTRVGISYLVAYAVILLSLFVIRPIASAVDAGIFPFSAWFYSFINNFTSINLWIFTFAMLLSIGYIRGKANNKFDLVFSIIATYSLVWFLLGAINQIFSTALAAGALGKLRGSAVGARAYDWAGFITGLFMIGAGLYFFFNAKFIDIIKDLFKEILVLCGHGERVNIKTEDIAFGKQKIVFKKPSKTKIRSEKQASAQDMPETEAEAPLQDMPETEAEAPLQDMPKTDAEALLQDMPETDAEALLQDMPEKEDQDISLKERKKSVPKSVVKEEVVSAETAAIPVKEKVVPKKPRAVKATIVQEQSPKILEVDPDAEE